MGQRFKSHVGGLLAVWPGDSGPASLCSPLACGTKGIGPTSGGAGNVYSGRSAVSSCGDVWYCPFHLRLPGIFGGSLASPCLIRSPSRVSDDSALQTGALLAA